MRLYDITSDYRALFDAFDDADDLTDDQIEAYFDTLEAIEGDFEIKAENVACFIKELSGEVDTLKAEEAALNARRRTKENLIARLKNMLVENMTAIDKRKIDRPRAKLSLRQNPESADRGENSRQAGDKRRGTASALRQDRQNHERDNQVRRSNRWHYSKRQQEQNQKLESR